MAMKQQLTRNTSNGGVTMMILPPSYLRSDFYKNNNDSSFSLQPAATQMICLNNYSYLPPSHDQSLKNNDRSSSSSTALSTFHRRTRGGVSSLIHSLLMSLISLPSLIIPATCRWLTANIISSASSTLYVVNPPLGRKVTGTLFGHRKGHISFAIQDRPDADPLLILDLAISTTALVKEMSSGQVRIALECEKTSPMSKVGKKRRNKKLFGEPEWTMYCNGRKYGTTRTRDCGDFELFVLDTIRSVSTGAGAIPVVDEGKKGSGELVYMRARFERVVGNRDSEAFYMLNPDSSGGPELSIFLLRL